MYIRGAKGQNIFGAKRQKTFACSDHPLGGGNKNSQN